MDGKRGRYEGYRGEKRWSVSHPVYGSALVLAPDSDSALVAAARVFGVDWTKVTFYSNCTITKS